VRFAAVLSLLLFQLGSPFVDAVAVGERAGSDVRVDLEVEVEALNVSTVFAHVLDPGGEQFTTPLNERGPGRYGAVITLPPADLVVVFEALAVGESVLSQPSTLTELGLDAALLEGERPFASVGPEPDRDEGLTTTTRRWGWAALAAVATSLALLAFWAAGPRRAQSPIELGPESGSDGGSTPGSAARSATGSAAGNVSAGAEIESAAPDASTSTEDT
jgi:hypothetical protein